MKNFVPFIWLRKMLSLSCEENKICWTFRRLRHAKCRPFHEIYEYTMSILSFDWRMQNIEPFHERNTKYVEPFTDWGMQNKDPHPLLSMVSEPGNDLGAGIERTDSRIFSPVAIMCRNHDHDWSACRCVRDGSWSQGWGGRQTVALQSLAAGLSGHVTKTLLSDQPDRLPVLASADVNHRYRKTRPALRTILFSVYGGISLSIEDQELKICSL